MTPVEEQRRLHAHIARALQAAPWQPGAQPAGLYLRVSTKGQKLENQVDSVVTMACARGFTVDVKHVFMEKQSGGDLDRPEMTRALEASARGRIRAIFVWAIDRLSRDDTFDGGVREIGTFDRHGCAVLSHEETYIDSSGPFRSVLVQFALRMAADERIRKNRRTTEAVKDRLKKLAEERGFWRKDRKDGRPAKFVTKWGRPPKYDPEVQARALAINADQPHLTVGHISRALCAESGGKWAVPKETVRSWLEKEGRTFALATRVAG